MTSRTNLITILGPTACGKTALATRLAARIGGQIISADSRQVYRGMDIGTGKDIDEYTVDGRDIPYHLVDIVDAGYKYNLYEYLRDFGSALERVIAEGDRPILCGGTGLYIEAVLKGYNMVEVPVNEQLRESLQGKSLEELRRILSGYKSLHNTTDTSTIDRAVRAIEIADYYRQNDIVYCKMNTKINPILFGIDIDRDERRRRISQRLQSRLDEGMADEVRNLLDSGISPEDLMYYGLEYKYLTQYVVGDISYDEMFVSLQTAIHRFAKRQMTWFRGMEKRGFVIRWLPYDMPDTEKTDEIISVISRL